MSRIITPELFWSRCQPSPDAGSSCLLYEGPGVRTPDGHIRIAFNGTKAYAHRVAFYLVYEVWPLMACHRCSVPACVRVGLGDSPIDDHLYNGNALLNARDRDLAGNRRPPLRPLHWSSRLTQADLDELVEARAVGLPATMLAQEYGVSPSTIRDVWRRAAAARSAA